MSLSVFAGIAVCIMLVAALVGSHGAFGRATISFVSRNILWIGFFVSLAAIAGSLVYSDVIGYPPCMLCWYARIAFYPQIILYGMALWKRDRDILDYSLGLTIFGLIVAITGTIIQIIGESPFPCAATGVSCTTRFVYEYGFIRR